MAIDAQALTQAMRHNDLGVVLAGQGRFAEALATFQEVLRLWPDYPEGHNNAGNVLAQMRRYPEAESSYRAALRLRPDYDDALNHLGAVLAEQGRFAEALASYEEALQRRPDFADAYYNRALALTALGKFEEALASYEQAVRLRPDFVFALQNLANLYMNRGRLDEAIACYRKTVSLRHDLSLAHYNLAIALGLRGQKDEAVASYEQAVRIKPDFADALTNLGNAYKDQGRIEEAVGLLRKAVAASPGNQAYHGNLLLTLQHSVDYDPETSFAEHRRWGEQFGASPVHRPAYPVEPDRGRRLRIGYVSGDFREHIVGCYCEAVLGAHDRGQFEVICYANVAHPDALTQRLQALADHWRSIWGQADDLVADQIRQDRIDILVDLAGHTAGSRLGVFAGKPAPIQVTHCGYPATTGLMAIDYRLTDAYCDPPGLTECWHTEALVRLPVAHWCYAAPPAPDVGPLPARRPGCVTFGSLNKLAKVTEPMIGLWSRILRALPESGMVVVTGAGSAGDERVRATFAKHGIGEERVRLLDRQNRDAYYCLYQGVDICLDTYPCSGGSTTTDALWMGVPVICLAGASCVSRLGVSALVHAGLEDLVTATPSAYVKAAVGLAQDVSRLRQVRSQLRERVKRSVGEVQRFTKDLEAAYRDMWETYCLPSPRVQGEGRGIVSPLPVLGERGGGEGLTR